MEEVTAPNHWLHCLLTEIVRRRHPVIGSALGIFGFLGANGRRAQSADSKKRTVGSAPLPPPTPVSCRPERGGGGASCVPLSKRFLYGLFLFHSLCARKPLHLWGTQRDAGASQCRGVPGSSSWLTSCSLPRCGCFSQACFSAIVCIVMRISKWHFPLMNRNWQQ